MPTFAYTPRNMTYEDLKNTFVGRDKLYEELMETLEVQADTQTLQHWMILGTRGMGKSHLISLFCHEIARDPVLSKKWLPVLMNEEEQGVFSLATFFFRVIENLANALDAGGEADESQKILDFIEELRDQSPDPKDLLEDSLAFLKDFVSRRNQRLVVFPENTDELFTHCLPETSDIKKLRNILSTENFMLIIAASPTSFDRITNPNAVMYDLFKTRLLELLEFDNEAVVLLEKWAKMDGKETLRQQIKNKDYRLRVLYHLTGGNPRLLYFLYLSISSLESLENASDTFARLLDHDLTGYYSSRMKDLSNQVQPVVLALAKGDGNMTQKEIARTTFLPERSLGTVILRLERDGIIRSVSGKKGKNTIYALTDNLFRLWRQWRNKPRTRPVLSSLVEFLAIWYSRQELEEAIKSCPGLSGTYCQEAISFRDSNGFLPFQKRFHVEGVCDMRGHLKKGDFYKAADIMSSLLEYKIKATSIIKSLTDGDETINDDNVLSLLNIRLKKEPSDIDALIETVRIFLRKDDYHRAEDHAQKAVNISSDNDEPLALLGISYMLQDKFVDAEKTFRKILKISPDDAFAWFNLGVACGKQDKHSDAEKAYKKGLKIKPDNADAWFDLGVACGKQDKHAAAEKAYKKGLKIKPDNANAWFNLGVACGKQDKHADAEKAYKKGLKLSPDDADAWFNLGVACGNQDKHAAAEKAYKKSLEIEPDNANAWFNLGLACGNQDKHAAAEKAFRKGLEIKADDATAWFNLGLACLKQDKHAAAEKAYKKGLKIKPDNADAWFNLGVACLKQDKHVDTEKALKKGLEIKPDEPIIHNAHAVVLFRLCRFDEALHALKKAINLDPGDRENYADKCEIYLTCHKPVNIIDILDSAVSLPDLSKDFTPFILLLRSLILFHQGESSAFRRTQQNAMNAVEKLPEKIRREVMRDFVDFLVEIISEKNHKNIEAYVQKIGGAADNSSTLAIIRPLEHVFAYIKEYFSRDKKGSPQKKAQRIMDRVPAELKGPVKEMIDTILTNQEWRDKQGNKAAL